MVDPLSIAEKLVEAGVKHLFASKQELRELNDAFRITSEALVKDLKSRAFDGASCETPGIVLFESRFWEAGEALRQILGKVFDPHKTGTEPDLNAMRASCREKSAETAKQSPVLE